MTCESEILFNGLHLLGALFIAGAFFLLGRARRGPTETSLQQSVPGVVKRERANRTNVAGKFPARLPGH